VALIVTLLADKVENALDETRTLILSAQVLLGLHAQAEQRHGGVT
jgi:hypothetical protein